MNNIYSDIEPKAILKALNKQASDYDLPACVYILILESYDSKFWITKGYDGKTLLPDKRHPDLPVWVHDYFWRTGRGGFVSDIIFAYLTYKTADSFFEKYILNLTQLIMVTIAWWLFYKWKHLLSGNVSPYTGIQEVVYSVCIKLLKDKLKGFVERFKGLLSK